MAETKNQSPKPKLERRQHPRLPFHCKATIHGIHKVVKVTDISLGGFFFELKTKKKLKMGVLVDVNMRLPTETNTLRFKAKLISQDTRGIGCKYVSLTPDIQESIRNCFEIFKDTLPID